MIRNRPRLRPRLSAVLDLAVSTRRLASRSTMERIGAFTVTKDGYAGTTQTLTINTKARFVANDQKANESAPDFRVYGGKGELGAAWKATSGGEEPREYLSVLFDDPSFAEPIRAALFEEDGAAFPVWNPRSE